MSGKIRKHDIFDSMHPYDGFDAIIATIQRAKAAEASGEWDGLELDCGDYDYHSSRWVIKGYRWENDKEYDKRMKDLEKAKEIKKKQKVAEEQNEKKLYEKLKKKFEGKNNAS